MKILTTSDGASTPDRDAQDEGTSVEPDASSQTIQIDSSNISKFAKENGASSSESPMTKAIMEGFAEARAQEKKELEESRRLAEQQDGGIDVAAHTESSPLLQSMPGAQEVASTMSGVKATREQKDAFIESLIANSRYTERFSLFNGRVVAAIRSRTLDESDSIESWLRHQVTTGAVQTSGDYGNLVRKAMLTAQVQRIGDVSYEELKGPMYVVEGIDGKKDPGWVEQLGIWGRAPAALCVALTRCIVEFEARYWYFVEHANDANFWNCGESTAE